MRNILYITFILCLAFANQSCESFLEEDGTLSKDIMPDLLHLNEASYRIWAEAVEEKVAELMGE